MTEFPSGPVSIYTSPAPINFETWGWWLRRKIVLEKCDGIRSDMDGKEEMVAARFSTEGTAQPGAPGDTETQLPKPGWPLNRFNTSCEIPRETQKFRAGGRCLDPNTLPLMPAGHLPTPGTASSPGRGSALVSQPKPAAPLGQGGCRSGPGAPSRKSSSETCLWIVGPGSAG